VRQIMQQSCQGGLRTWTWTWTFKKAHGLQAALALQRQLALCNAEFLTCVGRCLLARPDDSNQTSSMCLECALYDLFA